MDKKQAKLSYSILRYVCRFLRNLFLVIVCLSFCPSVCMSACLSLWVHVRYVYSELNNSFNFSKKVKVIFIYLDIQNFN